MTDRAFTTLAEFRVALASQPAADAAAIEAARDRNGQLTKPPSALGRLEELAIWFAGWRGTARPRLEYPQVIDPVSATL